MGAGPTGALGCGGLGGFVHAALNRLADRNEWATSIERLQYPPILEDLLIQRLLDTQNHFTNDVVPYACFPYPESNGYNSNSYTAG